MLSSISEGDLDRFFVIVFLWELSVFYALNVTMFYYKRNISRKTGVDSVCYSIMCIID